MMSNSLSPYNLALTKLLGNEMTDKNEISSIAKAFVSAQKDFSPALKTASNPFFKSKYADLSACVEAVIDALNANGIALMQHCSESDTGVIVETVFLHESGEVLNCGKLHVPASKNDPQGYGSALTYARRYSLMAACGIAPEDDDGNAASKAPKQSAPVEVITADQQTAIRDFIKDAGLTEKAFLEWGKIDSIEGMPATKYHKAVASLEKKIHDNKGEG